MSVLILSFNEYFLVRNRSTIFSSKHTNKWTTLSRREWYVFWIKAHIAIIIHVSDYQNWFLCILANSPIDPLEQFITRVHIFKSGGLQTQLGIYGTPTKGQLLWWSPIQGWELLNLESLAQDFVRLFKKHQKNNNITEGMWPYFLGTSNARHFMNQIGDCLIRLASAMIYHTNCQISHQGWHAKVIGGDSEDSPSL